MLETPARTSVSAKRNRNREVSWLVATGFAGYTSPNEQVRHDYSKVLLEKGIQMYGFDDMEDVTELDESEQWFMQKARESKEFGPSASVDDMYRWMDLYHCNALDEREDSK